MNNNRFEPGDFVYHKGYSDSLGLVVESVGYNDIIGNMWKVFWLNFPEECGQFLVITDKWLNLYEET